MTVGLEVDTSHDAEIPVLVSRQPVVDRELRITGHRIAYAQLSGLGPTLPTGAAALRLFDDTLSAVGLEQLTAGTLAHLPVSAEMLLEIGVPPVRPDRVLLRVTHDDAIQPAVRTVLETAASRGFALELDGAPGPEIDESLLDLFGTVALELPRWTDDELREAVPRILAARATPLASGVEDHARFESAKTLGFELFVGGFYAAPDVVSGHRAPVGDLRMLVSLARLQSEEVTLDDLVSVIDRDVGLSVRLLRYINSAFFGLGTRVGSVRHACVLLGARGIARWALLVALLGRSPRAPLELSLIALIRARMCELFGAGAESPRPDELFTAGLLSVADAVLGVPMDQLISELPLNQMVSDALLYHSGPAGWILSAVLAYERGQFDAPALEPFLPGHATAYRQALAWAREAMAGIS